VSRAFLLLVVLGSVGCATAAPPESAPVPSGEVRPATPGARAELERGQALFARGDMAGAATALREALRLQADLVAAHTALGLALQGLGDLDGAVEELRATLRRHPDALDARLALAKVLVARHEWPAAREELERVLAAQPDQLDARYALGVVR
jgi:tetratricopeptide (TPR) repeat protein